MGFLKLTHTALVIWPIMRGILVEIVHLELVILNLV